MKKFTAKFWRRNPQLANGGYETERTIEAKTIAQARKKAKEISERTLYGGMELLSLAPAE